MSRHNLIRHILGTAFLILFIPAINATETQTVKLRPPAVPLITHDPYFSIWSASDSLNDTWPTHWTGTVNAMCSMIKIDDKFYRVMGQLPSEIPALKQLSVDVLPTQTIYKFEADGLAVSLTFTTPALPHDVDILARPATYLTWEARSTDGKDHQIMVYFDASAEAAVNKPEQQVQVKRLQLPGLSVMGVGTVEQPVLKEKGDDVRIDWGHLYVAVPATDSSTSVTHVIAGHETSRNAFLETGRTLREDDKRFPRSVNDDWPVLACAFPLDTARDGAPASNHVIVAYDDEYSLELFGKRLRPYWRRDGMELEHLLAKVEKDYERLIEESRAFDQELMADLTRACGQKYALLCALSYRQALAGHKMAANEDGSLVMLSKENYSNGSIGTVDVLYPASPLFLLFNLDLLKAQITPVMDYATSERWRFPFAPHDLGIYPIANGQRGLTKEMSEMTADEIGGMMPVEESGNMLIMFAAIAQQEGNVAYSKQYWPIITQWAEYLKENGLDPENQLCTDDFTGHLAHNTNLSVKAIMGIGSYAILCEMNDKPEEAAEYKALAKSMAGEWMKKADDENHYRLTFDRPNTWSQKYNLVWNELLGLNVFPKEVAAKEVAFYKTKLNDYGLPLDSRQTYTKLDWSVWTAALTDTRPDFEAMTDPLFKFANETPDRSPLTDWFDTITAKRLNFTARSVVGGNFLPILRDKALTKKWLNRGGSQIKIER